MPVCEVDRLRLEQRAVEALRRYRAALEHATSIEHPEEAFRDLTAASATHEALRTLALLRSELRDLNATLGYLPDPA